jgi:hypothetical protein
LIPICPGYESQMRPCVYRFPARCCASWHTLGTPGDLYAQSEDALADDDSPSKRSQSYELTGDSFASIRLSQLCTSPSISRLYRHKPFNMTYSVARRFVRKSVHNTAAATTSASRGKLVTATRPNLSGRYTPHSELTFDACTVEAPSPSLKLVVQQSILHCDTAHG